MNKTSIEWCDFTANPIRYRDADKQSVWACVKASEGCQHCYAEALAHRYQGREFTAKAMEGVTPYVDERELKAMLSPAKLPAGSTVFVGDMTDMFGPWVPFELLDRVFAVFAIRHYVSKCWKRNCAHATGACSDLPAPASIILQLLTKRPERMREYITTVGRREAVIRAAHHIWDMPMWAFDWMEWPLPNVWLGVSAENQHWADVRIPELLATPAAVRFVSAEPLLGTVRLEVARQSGVVYALTGERSVYRGPDGDEEPGNPYANGARIDWVIVGGESGPRARPCDVGWIRSIVAQCQAAGTKVFVKQLGARPYVRWLETEAHPVYDEGDPGFHEIENLEAWLLRDRKGGDMAEWPEDLRVREWPLETRVAE